MKMFILLLALALLSTSCLSFGRKPAEDRCRDAGLKVEAMKIQEHANGDQQAGVSCKAHKDILE